RGIGRETARRIAAAHAKIVVNYNRSAKDAEEVAAQIGASHARAIQADVSNPDDAQRLVAQTIDVFGRLDIVVNNAARYAENRFDRDDYDGWHEGWRQTFELNVFGAANVAFHAMRWMRANGGGKIINVASRAAFRGETEFA